MDKSLNKLIYKRVGVMVRISASYSPNEQSAVVVMNVSSEGKYLLHHTMCNTFEDTVNCIMTYYVVFGRGTRIVLDKREGYLIEAVHNRLQRMGFN